MAKEEGSRKRNQTFVQTNVAAVFVGKRKVGIKAELFFRKRFQAVTIRSGLPKNENSLLFSYPKRVRSSLAKTDINSR